MSVCVTESLRLRRCIPKPSVAAQRRTLGEVMRAALSTPKGNAVKDFEAVAAERRKAIASGASRWQTCRNDRRKSRRDDRGATLPAALLSPLRGLRRRQVTLYRRLTPAAITFRRFAAEDDHPISCAEILNDVALRGEGEEIPDPIAPHIRARLFSRVRATVFG